MIHALGWCDMQHWGSVGANTSLRHGATPDLSVSAEVEGLIGGEVRYYARMPMQTRLSLVAMGQALRASHWGKSGLREIGMTTAGFDGCLDANHVYFRDHVETGRGAGRGSLFIYTMATSTIGEAAIALGLSGPALYVHHDVDPVTNLIEVSRQMATDGQADGVLALWSDTQAAVCFAIGAESGNGFDATIEQHWESSPKTLAGHLTAHFCGARVAWKSA